MDTPSLNSQELRRYERHIMLPEIGKGGQLKMKQTRVLVVGAGGLGCPALQYLSAAGVGKLGIMDYDIVTEGNLHRQVLYGLYDLGKLKAIIAKTRLQQQNPLITYEIHNIRLKKDNALDLISNYDIVVDATDNYPTRYLINDACVILKKTMIYGSIYAYEGQVSVFNYHGGPTYRCLYPAAPRKGEVPDPSEVGLIGVIPGIIGILQANEVIKIATGIGNVMSGRILVVNMLEPSVTVFRIRKKQENLSITELGEYEP